MFDNHNFYIGQIVMLDYMTGEVDEVTILSLYGDGSHFSHSADVRLPDGRIATVLQDNLMDVETPISEHDWSHFESDDDCPACVAERNAWTKE